MDELGERGSGRKRLEERHKRELRRHRTDELKVGSGRLRRDLPGRAGRGPGCTSRPPWSAPCSDIHEAIEALERNPNEHLLLQALLLRLPAAVAGGGRPSRPGLPGGGAGRRPLQLHGHSPR